MASRTKAFFGALACLLALIWMGVEPAAAMPFRAAAPVMDIAASTRVGIAGVTPEKVHWRNRRHRYDRYRRYDRRHRYYRHRRHSRPGVSFWFGSGPLFGSYVGVPYGGYRYRPGPYYSRAPLPSRAYRGRPYPGSPEWYAYCASKYKSFNPRTGLYLAYSGKYRRCR